MNIPIQVFVWTYILISFGYISRNRITVPYGKSISNFLRSWQSIFSSGHTIYVPTINMSASVFPHPCPTLVIVHLVIRAILMDVKWYLTVVLMSISLMTNDVEQLYMCLLELFFLSSPFEKLFPLFPPIILRFSFDSFSTSTSLLLLNCSLNYVPLVNIYTTHSQESLSFPTISISFPAVISLPPHLFGEKPFFFLLLLSYKYSQNI